MNEIYVVIKRHGFSSQSVEHCFADKEKADICCEYLNKLYPNSKYEPKLYRVEQYSIDDDDYMEKLETKRVEEENKIKQKLNDLTELKSQFS